MKTTITKSILMALALIAVVPSANAQIASKEYVDDELAGKMDTMTIDETPTAGSDNLVTSGGVYNEINNVAYNTIAIAGQAGNRVLTTGSTGRVSLTDGLVDSYIARTANIQLGKLQFPTPPAACSSSGCMLMFYDGKYVWEPIARDSGESVSTTGYVSATATGASGGTMDAASVADELECDRIGGSWGDGVCVTTQQEI